jgi:hypothetical protein
MRAPELKASLGTTPLPARATPPWVDDRRPIRMLLTLLALSATGAAPGQASRAEPPFWEWRSQPAPAALTIDFIRGDITIVRRDGPLEIRVFRSLRAGRTEEVRIAVADENGVLVVQDAYPASLARLWDECLPPMHERGDFWSNSVFLSAVVTVPPATRVSATVLEGRVAESEQAP